MGDVGALGPATALLYVNFYPGLIGTLPFGQPTATPLVEGMVTPGANKGSASAKRTDNTCLSGWSNSALGKTVQFFSVVNLVTDFKSAWPDWTVFPAVKLATATAVKSLSTAIGNTEFLSVTGGSSTVIEGTAAAGIDAIESAGPGGLLVIPIASAVDAGARSFCSSYPTAPPLTVIFP